MQEKHRKTLKTDTEIKTKHPSKSYLAMGTGLETVSLRLTNMLDIVRPMAPSSDPIPGVLELPWPPVRSLQLFMILRL